jgi:hypothetical protein
LISPSKGGEERQNFVVIRNIQLFPKLQHCEEFPRDAKMPKEKSINPAQAQRKADKAKAIKKGTTLPTPCLLHH